MFTALFIELNQNDLMANWYRALDRPQTLGLITREYRKMIGWFYSLKMERNRAKWKILCVRLEAVCLEDRKPTLNILLWLILSFKQVQAT